MTRPAESGLRVAVFGATGALGREVVAVLEERTFPVRDLALVASDRSLGEEIEFQGDTLSVQTELPPLRGLDLVIGCAPGTASLELVRLALRAEVSCIDCSGALAGSREVPLLVSDLCSPAAVLGAPVIATPPGPALGWWLALEPLARAVGLQRVVATVLRSAIHAGRSGIEVLSRETVALLSQQTPPVPELFPAPVAFDCLPRVGSVAEADSPQADTPCELELVRDVRRLVEEVDGLQGGEAPVSVAVTAVQVPAFVSDGSAMWVETRRPLDPSEAGELLDKAPGVDLWRDDRVGPSLRDAASSDVALVGRLRRDPSVTNGLQFWLAADGLRLAAVNVVKLAETRLRLN
ncbi:MAG: Asd/ArgC dimerization domain-containing protein [Myxococcota bacterium]